MSEAEDLRGGIPNAQLPALTDVQVLLLAVALIMDEVGVNDEWLDKS